MPFHAICAWGFELPRFLATCIGQDTAEMRFKILEVMRQFKGILIGFGIQGSMVMNSIIYFDLFFALKSPFYEREKRAKVYLLIILTCCVVFIAINILQW